MLDKMIQWYVTPEEAQVILNALQDRPFREVAALIPRLVASANEQMTVEDVGGIVSVDEKTT